MELSKLEHAMKKVKLKLNKYDKKEIDETIEPSEDNYWYPRYPNKLEPTRISGYSLFTLNTITKQEHQWHFFFEEEERKRLKEERMQEDHGDLEDHRILASLSCFSLCPKERDMVEAWKVCISCDQQRQTSRKMHSLLLPLLLPPFYPLAGRASGP